MSQSSATPTAVTKTGAAFRRGQSKQDYATPPDFIQAVVRRFGPLALDLAATASNAKAPLFFDIAQDALAQSWHRHAHEGQMWLNPPFDSIGPWAKKCAEESKLGAAILFLVPASVGSNWFGDFVFQKAHVLFLQGRLHFDPANPAWGYPKDCMLAVYDAAKPCGFEVWRWR
jgi:phage N-6-adenine-methyltransferase